MADDNIENVHLKLKELRDYQRSFHPNQPPWENTFGTLISAIQYLSAEVEALRDEVSELRGK